MHYIKEKSQRKKKSNSILTMQDSFQQIRNSNFHNINNNNNHKIYQNQIHKRNQNLFISGHLKKWRKFFFIF